MDKLTGFFIGCSSPEGFTSFLDELYNPHENSYAYIIKGGPGTGKSTLMKKIYSILKSKNISPECIFCSSDPDSLDALIIPELNCCIADGTNPHAIEPRYYGVCEEFINLGDYLDRNILLKSKENIIETADQNKAEHDRCKYNLKAAYFAHSEMEKLVLLALDSEKIKESAEKLAEKEFSINPDKKSKIYHRYISAPTSRGLYFNSEKVTELCNRFYILDDECSVFSPLFLDTIKNRALDCNLDLILSPNALLGKDRLQHILVPELKLGFISSNRPNKILLPNSKRINAAKFADKEKLSESSNKISFYLKAHDEFMLDALKALKSSKISHDKLESMYIRAMKFDVIDSIAIDISNQMFKNF